MIHENLLEEIEAELASNRGINDLIAPILKDDKIQNHQLSLAGKGISNLDFLAKFIRENPQITGMNLEVDDFHEKEIAKVTKEFEQNTGINQFTMRGNKRRNKNLVYEEENSSKTQSVIFRIRRPFYQHQKGKTRQSRIPRKLPQRQPQHQSPRPQQQQHRQQRCKIKTSPNS